MGSFLGAVAQFVPVLRSTTGDSCSNERNTSERMRQLAVKELRCVMPTTRHVYSHGTSRHKHWCKVYDSLFLFFGMFCDCKPTTAVASASADFFVVATHVSGFSQQSKASA